MHAACQSQLEHGAAVRGSTAAEIARRYHRSPASQPPAEFRLPRPRRAHGIPLRPAIPLRQFSVVIIANSIHVTGSFD